MFTTYAVYYVNGLHLTPLQLVLVGTAVEAAMFLCEVPTGVVADSFSRRLSVIIGMFVLGLAYVLESSVPLLAGTLSLFGGVVAAEIIRGVGETFLSGAQEAWIADEVGPEKTGPVFVKAAQIGRLAWLAGIPISVGLAALRLNLPYLAGGLLYLLLGALLAVTMPEHGFTPQPREGRSPFQLMRETFSAGLGAVRSHRILMLVMIVSFLAGMTSEGFDRLSPAHLLESFTLPRVAWLSAASLFGVLAVVENLVGIGVNHLTDRFLDLGNPRAVSGGLLVSQGLRVVFLVAFALAGNFGQALGFFLAISATGAFSGPLFNTWVNQNVDSRVRSTVLSLMGQLNALGQSGGGPFVGWVGTRFPLRSAFLVSAILLSPVVAVYHRAFRHSGESNAA
jgi:MFS family permease